MTTMGQRFCRSHFMKRSAIEDFGIATPPPPYSANVRYARHALRGEEERKRGVGRPRLDWSRHLCCSCQVTHTSAWRHFRFLQPKWSVAVHRLCFCNACWLKIGKLQKYVERCSCKPSGCCHLSQVLFDLCYPDLGEAEPFAVDLPYRLFDWLQKERGGSMPGLRRPPQVKGLEKEIRPEADPRPHSEKKKKKNAGSCEKRVENIEAPSSATEQSSQVDLIVQIMREYDEEEDRGHNKEED